MKFQLENLSDVLEESKPLLFKHWEEIAHYKDIVLEPDYDAYSAMDSMGMVRVFTAREGDKLIGYAVYFIKNNIHYRRCKQAIQDILFMDPLYRGRGLFFLRWCDNELRNEGVQIVVQHVKAAHDFGKGLIAMGYEAQDIMYTKRLDK